MDQRGARQQRQRQQGERPALTEERQEHEAGEQRAENAADDVDGVSETGGAGRPPE